MMRFHILVVAALVAGPSVSAAQSGLSFDFKMTENTGGQLKSSVGHALVLGNNVRMDIVGPSSFATIGPMSLGDTVAMISADTGMAQVVSLVGAAGKQYIQFAPMVMMKKMKDMMAQMGGSPQLDFAGSQVVVDSLGDGGMIAGYNTLHYRTTIAMRIAMGGQPVGEQNIVNDLYVAPELKDFARGTSLMSASDQVGAIPGIPKTLTDQITSAAQRTGYALALKVETSTTGSMMGTGMSRKQTLEVTSVKKVDVPASAFVVPAGYKKVVPPGMEAIM
jgi:hypothetical protein